MRQSLLILRHAEAEGWTAGGSDKSRNLSSFGRANAQKVAGFLVGQNRLPDEILCSPAVRTRQTLEPLLKALPDLEASARYVPEIYGAPADKLIGLLDFAFVDSVCVMVVGHNPGIGVMASRLAIDAHGGRIGQYPPGTLSLVEFSDGWTSGGAAGDLVFCVTGSRLSVD